MPRGGVAGPEFAVPPQGGDGAAGAEPVYRSERTVVRRLRAADGRRLIVKQAMGPCAAARTAAEAAVLRRLAEVPGVPRLLGVDGATSLLLQDCGDRELSEMVGAGACDPRQLLTVLVDLAEVLAAVHQAGVVHRDLNPSNVVVGEDTPAHLVDFDLATVDGQAWPGFVDGATVLGHLPYLAPEQTGRTGWPVDRRSDLYGLGATAYALATGQPPFGDGDPVALIRDILVGEPVALAERVPQVPRALSAIVDRLLEKDPDRRYQGARGLLIDLHRVAADPDEDFAPGRWDFPARLRPPARLVGRERQMAGLELAFDEVVHGLSAAVLVGGEPGVGKSVLIEQLRPVVTARGGWYVAGKADQFAHDPGSNVFAQATTQVGNLLLGLPKQHLDPIRERILSALGDNAGLVTAVLPVFEHLLGVPPEVADGDPLENERRLAGSAPALFRAIVGPDRPLVLVVDDLQWADPSALTVIDRMLTDQVPGVLLVGGYRSTEVDAAHPLTAMIQRWERLGVAPRHLELEPLPGDAMADLLEGVLRLDRPACGLLARELAARSRGNPYETLELVNALYTEGVLRLGDGGWEWDDAQLREFVAFSDVAQMLRTRIGRLPGPTREALQVMACLGAEVSREVLAAACDVDAAGLAERLGPALAIGLLVGDTGGDRPDGSDGTGPGTCAGDGPGGTGPGTAAGAGVRFGHDRIQQVAHELLDDRGRAALHLALARPAPAGPRRPPRSTSRCTRRSPTPPSGPPWWTCSGPQPGGPG